jgi:hypothetical protein
MTPMVNMTQTHTTKTTFSDVRAWTHVWLERQWCVDSQMFDGSLQPPQNKARKQHHDRWLNNSTCASM